MAEDAINRGSLDSIVNSHENGHIEAQPILQLARLKLMAQTQQNPGQRWHMILSDVDHFCQGLLSTELNHLVENGTLKQFAILRVKAFTANIVRNPQKPTRKVLIVTDLEVLQQYDVYAKIGLPTEVEFRENGATGPQNTVVSSNGGITGRQFYGNSKPAAPQQPAARSLPQARQQGKATSAHPNLSAIDALNPFAHKWAIRARCSHKSDIKTWHNRNGEGKLFSVNLLDESGEIRATGFNDQCDNLYDLFQDGVVYYIDSPCKVQLANKKFSNLSHDYELTFERDTVVVKAEDQNDVPQIKFNFTPIGDLQSVEKDTTIDTMGILKEVGQVEEITAKSTGKAYQKRELTLVDESGFSVRLTIWGNTALTFDVDLERVVAFKGLKVSDYNGRTLSLLSSGSMTVNPDIDEAYKLKGWYQAAGKTTDFNTHSGAAMGAAGGREDPSKTIAQIKEETELNVMSETPIYFSLKATVIFVKQENVMYPACINCNRKVTEETEGSWRCEKCNDSRPSPEYRFKLWLNVTDHTGQMYLSGFDDVGRIIMKTSANELQQLIQNDDVEARHVFQDSVNQSWVFKCRAKMDTYQEQPRVQYTISGVSPVNYIRESEKMMAMIKLYDE